MPIGDELIRRARPWLGTIVEIGVPHEYEPLIDTGFAEVERIHNLMSFHCDTSDLAKLRAARPGTLVNVAHDTVHLLRIAAYLNEVTEGIFDITVGRQLVRTRFLPPMDTAHLNRFTGDVRDIEIVGDRHVRLRRRLVIDFGGIAKGYGVDCAVTALKAAGAQQGVVNAGGDLRIFGNMGMPVKVRTTQSGYSAAFIVQNSALASSENSRTRRMFKGQAVSPHIGRERKPVLIDQTITVMASTCMIADAMTKIAMVDPTLANRLLTPHDGRVVQFEMCEAA